MVDDRHARLQTLARRARSERAAFDPPARPPDEHRARSYLRDGLGPALAIYIESRTDETQPPLSPDEHSTLETTINDWLGLYARCYETRIEAVIPARTAATALIETGSLLDTAQLLTHVPQRTDDRGSTNG
ncbi:hypothetical protein [Halocatena halophila]|uniref:hypothetical protein n=1 Tax=Halocatena halophila TaxID=2814576 RepID=UPI002ED0C516